MTTPLRQFILKRGNTTVSSTYTGPVGEITYDTGLNAIRIHDGITPGGNLMPSDGVFSSLSSNVTVLQGNVITLFSNASTQQNNISVLQANVATLQSLASSANDTPPALPGEGALWYDDVSGRLYVYFDGFWIDASPDTIYTLPAATANTLGGIKVGGNLSIVDGVLSANTNLGNLAINNQTILGKNTDQDIVLSPAGDAYVSVPKLKIPVGTLVEGTANITITIANLTLSSLVDYSTSSSDNLSIGDYDLTNGVSGAGTGWAVYEFTTDPTPELQVGDHIAGVGVPFLSNVLHIGTGPNTNIIITDRTITSAPPEPGAQIFTTRDVVNAGLNISTQENTDISLIPGPGGHIVTSSDIIPFVHDVYTLGTPAKRFKEIWLGAGTIYILDETLGTDQAIGARDGNVYIAGGTGLTVGKFTLTGNTISLNNASEDFYIGSSFATGNLNINRPLHVLNSSGNVQFAVDRTGRTQFRPPTIPANDIGAVSIIGSTGGAYQPVLNPGGMLHLTGNDGSVSRITNDGFGTASFPAYISRAGRGTAAEPSAMLSGDILSRYSTVGWGSTNFPTGPAATNIEVYARENFTDVSQGTEYRFYTAPVGTTTKTLSATINDSGVSLFNTGNVSAGVRFRDNTLQTTAWLGDASLDTVNANVTAANAAIAALQSNAAAQSTDIATLFSNAVTQNTALTTLTANAAAQSTDIATLFSNAATQAVQITSIATNAVNVVTAGFGMSVSRNNGTVGVDALGVTTVAGTANQVLVNAGTSAANAAITLTLPQSIAPSSTVTFANLTITGNLNVEGNIITSENSSLDSKILYLANLATSSDQLDGGGIILGNVDAAFKRTFLYDFNSDTWDTDGAGLTTLELHAQDAIFSGNVFSNGSAHFGATNMVSNFDNAEVQIDSNRNDFSQLVHQNHNSGTNASTDFVATNDIGTDESNFIDLGINSSTYTQAEYSITGPNDGYLFINGGNLAIGTQSAANVIRFHTGGTTSDKLRLTIDDSGLIAVGNITAQYFVGSGQYLTDLYSNANVTAYLTTDSNIAAIWANITAIDAAWQANAAIQEDEISELRANITAANAAIVTANSAVVSYVNTLNSAMTANITAVNLQISNTSVAVFANAASQQVTINALGAGATAANLNISALQSNTATLASSINILFANAGVQENSISALRANITAANAAIVTANNSVVSYVDTLNSAMTANVTAANAAIVTANNAVVSYVNTLNSAMAANVTAANAAIVTANNAVVSYLNNLNSLMIANVNAANVTAASYTNLQIQSVVTNWEANAAIQENEISALRANIIAANASIVGSNYGNANVAAYLPTNATIQAINANVTAANAAIVTANTGMKSYVDGLNSAMAANVTAANAAIVTANTGMKSYVDGQVSTLSSGFASNAVSQQTQINNLIANVGTSTIRLGNIQIVDQTISGTVLGRDVTFETNDGGASFVFDSNILPSLNYVYTLGNKTRRWAKAYHGPRSIDIDGILLDTDTETAPAGVANLFISNAGGITANIVTSNTVIKASGNITTTGNVVASANVQASYFFGDGSRLTNLPSSSSFGTSILAGTLSINPTSVNKNAVSTQTFTISGLTNSHKILVTPGTALTYGIFITAAWPSATDTVSVQIMNITGGSIDLGSIDLQYLAWV